MKWKIHLSPLHHCAGALFNFSCLAPSPPHPHPFSRTGSFLPLYDIRNRACSNAKFIWVQLNLEGFIITYLLAEADLAVRFYPRPIDLVRMFTPEVTGRASICIRPWARFFPPLIGLSMSAPCLLTLITLFFPGDSATQSSAAAPAYQPEEERETNREREREEGDEKEGVSTRWGQVRVRRGRWKTLDAISFFFFFILLLWILTLKLRK